MKGIIKSGLVVAISALTVPAHADVWDVDTTIGVMPAVMNYSSQEPEGNTSREMVVYPLTLNATFNINRINRIVTDLRYVDFDIPAGNGGLGVTVNGYQFSTMFQHQFRLARNFRPWVGGGVVSSIVDTTDRYRTDSDGFLVERFDDRSETSLAGVVSAGLEFEITRQWHLAVEARYERPFSDGLEGYGAAGGIRYRF